MTIEFMPVLFLVWVKNQFNSMCSSWAWWNLLVLLVCWNQTVWKKWWTISKLFKI